jgi:hypothetical protein
MTKHPSKELTLSVNDVYDKAENDSDENDADSDVDNVNVNNKTTLDKLMEEETDRIPFFRRLNIKHCSFFMNPLTPSFLRIYGPQIRTVRNYNNEGKVVPEQTSFYQALPNLTQLSTYWSPDNLLDVKMPAMQRLTLDLVLSALSDRAKKTFLLNFLNLTHLWQTPLRGWNEYLEVMSALGSYLAIRNRWDGASRKPLTIIFEVWCFGNPYYDKLEVTEDVAQFLQELAVADGSILIENMPVELLDEAVRLFNHQRRGQLLRSFGKCIRSLFGFSSSLYEVELPNVRKLEVFGTLDGTSKNGDFARTVSWPKLEGVNVGLRRKEALAVWRRLCLGVGCSGPRSDGSLVLWIYSPWTQTKLIWGWPTFPA